MKDFKQYKLSDLYSIDSGISISKDQSGFGYPFLSFKTVFNNYFLPPILQDYMNTTETQQKKYSIKQGDIFLTRTSETNDELAMSSVALKDYPTATYSGFLKRLRPKNNGVVYEKYIAFYLRNNFFRKVINNYTSLTLRASFNEELFSYLSVYLPSYQTQKIIGDLLFLFESKISINNSIISKLEEMAKTIYEYWFLQFDFPNHEGKPYASSGGAMKYSKELGRAIPTDWEAIEIDKICKIYSGFAFKSAQYAKEGKYRLITIKNVQENGVLLEPANFIDELPKKLPAYCLLEQGDILMSLTGNVGRVGLMFDDMCLLNQRVAKICPSNEEMRGLIYFLFKSTFVKSKMENMAGGTSQENLSPIETGKILIPYNEKIFRSFSKVANQWASMIVKKQRENQKLAQLRDWLLPMLMNGQVRVE